MKFEQLSEAVFPTTFVIISGLHGDEPAGNYAAKHFKDLPNVVVFSNLNKSNKRRINRRDPNRHFDKDNKNTFQNNLLDEIDQINPVLVISLHEDDEVDEVYAYSSPEIESKVAKALSNSLIPLASSAHGDKAKNGVIVRGKQPYEGTLERALARRNIPYCTIETPSQSENIEKRIKSLILIVNSLLEN